MDDEKNPSKNNTKKLSKHKIWTAMLLILFVLLVIKIEDVPAYRILRWRGWTGIGGSTDEKISKIVETMKLDKNGIVKTTITYKSEPGKSLWDLMGLFIAPATLAIFGIWFQTKQDKQREGERVNAEESEKRRTEGRQRYDALQVYFDHLSALLVDKGSGELEGKGSIPKIVINIIKVRTLSLLRMLKEDSEHKISVVYFLANANLLSELELDLSEFDLSGEDLRHADLSKTRLQNATLIRTNLENAIFNGTDFLEADLSQTNFKNAILKDVDFREATLTSTLFIDASLNKVDFTNANLERTNFAGATITEVIFTGAKKLTVDQIKAAKNWSQATYDDEFWKKLNEPNIASKADDIA